jgi:acyl carrier protein
MSQREGIFEFLKTLLLGVLDVEESHLTRDTPVASLGLESLDFVELQVEFQKKYGVKVQGSLFANGQITTLGQFVDYVDQQFAVTAQAV